MKEHKGHIAYLDGWRGLAISAVFFGHFVSKASYWWVGTFGVQLFFVLSGLLMCNILFFKDVALPDFFARRLLRVGPTFLLFVLAVTIYTSAVQPVRYVPSATEVVSILFFLRSYFPADASIINGQWPIGHLWSLNVEEHTYMFLALCALVARQFRLRWITASILSVATVAAFIFSVHHYKYPAATGTPSYLLSEAASLGTLAAVAINYMKRTWLAGLSERIHPLVPLASLVLAFACFTDPLRWRGLDFIVAPLLLAFTINYLDRVPAALIGMLSNKRLGWIGRVSFSLYIWQQPFHLAVCQGDMNAWLGTSLALALGLVSFYAFENPLRIRLTQAWEARNSKNQSITEQDGAFVLK